MKVEYEPGAVSYRPVYISVDGTRHYRKIDAIIHDATVLAGTRYVAKSGILLPDDEIGMDIFHITSQEDWDYVYYTEWEQNIFGDKYTGPGWYGSIKHDGGDYDDDYEIIKIDSNYFKKYEDYIKELKHLTSDENMI